jgi:hypothetical protein
MADEPERNKKAYVWKQLEVRILNIKFGLLSEAIDYYIIQL